ncbi:MAG: arginine repressor [Actinomycetota bacterium]
MTTPRTQAARRTRIAEVLSGRRVHSQEELRGILASEGFAVTQATLSRDLVDLGAVKRPTGDGRAVYPRPGEPGAPARPSLSGHPGTDAGTDVTRLVRAAHELVVSVDHSANIVVVRTPPGGAQYLASAFDRTQWPPIIGTVAGDDTVLLVTRGADAGAEVAAEILAMAEGRMPGGAEVP